MQSWTISWFVNLAGSIIMALIVHEAWIFHGREEFTIALAAKKASYPFSVCMCKAILANWLVNLAVWIANAAQVGRCQCTGLTQAKQYTDAAAKHASTVCACRM